ncbi:hypothetical protein I4U23_015576 [Adineta vaga]|nr:hypothetical protein I4U23_015576 [Adineta vaga]
MSSSINSFVTNLNLISTWINRVFPVLQIVFGTCGNLFNIIVFTRPTLRDNPCSMYFLAGTISNFIEIYMEILYQYLKSNWNWDPTNTNTIWCIIRNWLTYPALCLVLWFIVLSSFDRFLISSHNVRIRRMSNTSAAKKTILFTILCFFLIYAHMPFFYRAIRLGTLNICTVQSSEYIIFSNILFVMVFCLLPILFMVIFGTLTFINVRTIRNRINPQFNNTRQERIRANDRQLTRMLLSQVLITTLLSVPYCCINMYSTFVLTLLKKQLSTSDRAIFSLTFYVTRTLHFTNPVIGFYVYTLSSSKFNAEFKRCIRYGLRIIFTTTGIIKYLPRRRQQVLLNL